MMYTLIKYYWLKDLANYVVDLVEIVMDFEHKFIEMNSLLLLDGYVLSK